MRSETRSATVSIESGCIYVRPLKGVSQSLEDAQENVAACRELTGGKRSLPLLVDLRETEPLSSEVRHYYTGGGIAEAVTAMGLLVDGSPLGRMMGNVFLRLMYNPLHKKPKVQIKTRIFSDERRAFAWLVREGRRETSKSNGQ